MAYVMIHLREVDLQDGVKSFVILAEGRVGHFFKYHPEEVISSCGETQERFECSCGFAIAQMVPSRSNQPSRVRRLDATHAALLLLGAQAARQRDIGCSDEWQRLEDIAFQAFKGIDEGLTATRAFLRMQFGAPSASQLREILGR